MAIENRNLEVGTRLIAKYLKLEYHAEVVAGEGGKVLYQLPDGREFKSPSSAATAITGKAANGWNFWSVESENQENQDEDAPEYPAPHGRGHIHLHGLRGNPYAAAGLR